MQMMSTWYGVPITEMPREELEAEFIKAQYQLAKLKTEMMAKSVLHVQDLARMAKRF